MVPKCNSEMFRRKSELTEIFQFGGQTETLSETNFLTMACTSLDLVGKVQKCGFWEFLMVLVFSFYLKGRSSTWWLELWSLVTNVPIICGRYFYWTWEKVYFPHFLYLFLCLFFLPRFLWGRRFLNSKKFSSLSSSLRAFCSDIFMILALQPLPACQMFALVTLVRNVECSCQDES